MAGDLRLLRRLPADLAAVVALAVAAAAAVAVPVVRDSPLRVGLGLVFVLFLPGYAVVAALFPERGPDRPADGDGAVDSDDANGEADGGDVNAGTDAAERRDGGAVTDRLFPGESIDGIERVALSVGLSISIVPLVGLVLSASPWGLRTGPVVASVCGLTLAATAVAARRRRALPPDERFAVPYREWYAAARSGLLAPDSRGDLALNVVLSASVVVAAASVGYAVAGPTPGERFTELYLLSEDESGELVADEYPTEFVRGEPGSLVVGVDNHEGRPVDYTLVVLAQTVNDTGTVVSEREVRRFHPRVAANDTWLGRHAVVPETTRSRLRLVYLLYEGPAPSDPSVENAYRRARLWVNVSRPTGGAAVRPPDADSAPRLLSPVAGG